VDTAAAMDPPLEGVCLLAHLRQARRGQTEEMNSVAVVVLIVLLALPLVIVGIGFVWAAIHDGEEDRAVQRRLGIRRKTRLGR